MCPQGVADLWRKILGHIQSNSKLDKHLFTCSILFNLNTKSIDFTLAFLQADADTIIYMELPCAFQAFSDRYYVILLIKNIYGLKQAAKIFYVHSVDILINELEYIPSMMNPYVFCRGNLSLITYWQLFDIHS